MKAHLLFWLVFLCFLTLSCTREQPNKARASQLLREIREIAQNSSEQMRADDIMGLLKRLNEKKEYFPDNRREIEDAAKAAKDFFTKGLDDDEKLIDRYNELLTLGLVSHEADCVRLYLESQRIQSELTKTT